MKITIFGAGGGQVTGSAYVVESGKSKVLVDCGMFQGVPNADQKNRIAQEFTFRNLVSVLITHAHLDHTGIADPGAEKIRGIGVPDECDGEVDATNPEGCGEDPGE